jgi:hypothetical protein
VSLRVPVTFANIVSWVRDAANAINGKQDYSTNLQSIADLDLTGMAGDVLSVTVGEDGFELTAGGGGSGLADGDYGDITASGGGTVLTIDNDVVTPAKMANVATSTVFYRKTAGTGDPEVNTLATLKTDLGLTGTNSGDQTITLSGDVSGSGTGAITTTIGAGKVTLAMQANVATGTVFYRKTAGSGAPEVQTLATLKTDLGLTGTNSGDQTITLTGDVTGSGTGSFAATLANSGVTAATYVLPRIVVDAKGRITSATSKNRNRTTTVTTASTSASIPLDGTIPQNTEGAEALSLTITPTSSTAKLRVQAIIKCQASTAGFLIASLFVNTGANAVDASSVYQSQATGGVNIVLDLRIYSGIDLNADAGGAIRCQSSRCGHGNAQSGR